MGRSGGKNSFKTLVTAGCGLLPTRIFLEISGSVQNLISTHESKQGILGLVAVGYDWKNVDFFKEFLRTNMHTCP